MCIEFVLRELSRFSFFQPIYKKFTENKWDSSNEIMSKIIETTSKHISDFRTLKDPFYQVSPREISGGFWDPEAVLSVSTLCDWTCLDPR